MLSRRDVMARLAAGAAAACVAGMARTSLASARHEERMRTGSGQEPDQLGPAAPNGPASAPEQLSSWPIDDEGPPATLSAPPCWELISPLASGAVLTHGWRVAGLTGVVNGTCVLTLENERGRAHRVHLCRNDGRPQGLVYTNRVDLVVMNGGLGDLPTEEGFAQAVAKVAHVLAANEGSREHDAVVAKLLPHAERLQRFAAAAALR